MNAQAGMLQRPFNPSWGDYFGAPPAQPANAAAFPSTNQTTTAANVPTQDAHNSVKIGIALFGLIVLGILTAYFIERES